MKYDIEKLGAFVLNIVFILFICLGCNLSVSGHFFPDTIIPYVFLIFAVIIVLENDIGKILADKKKKMSVTAIISFFVVAIYFFLLRSNSNSFFNSLFKSALIGISFYLALICLSERYHRECFPAGNYKLWLCIVLQLVYFYQYRTELKFSLFPVLLLLTELVIYQKVKPGDLKKRKCLIVFSILFGLFESLGYSTLVYQEYTSKSKWLLLVIEGILAWTLVFSILLFYVIAFIERISNSSDNNKVTKKRCFIVLLVMISVRMVYFFNWYPGLIVKDTSYQIQQALGMIPYSNHHPWLHTMVIKFFLFIGKQFGGENQLGIAIMSFVSVILTSICLTLLLRYYGSVTMNRVQLLIMTIIYSIGPIHCIYSVHLWDDTAFAYLLLLFVFLLIRMGEREKENGTISLWQGVLFVIVSFLFCFSRPNGLYAWLFSAPFIVFHFRKCLKRIIPIILACIIMILGYKFLILPANNVSEADTVESLSVPLQQMAFTISDGGKMSSDDIDVISHFADISGFGNAYDPHISDPVKKYIRNSGNEEWLTQNKKLFFKTYVDIGIKNPCAYLTAFANQSKGYWYQKLSNNLYYDGEVNKVANECDIYSAPKFGAGTHAFLVGIMNLYCEIWHRLWSLALNSYVLIICLLYTFYMGKKRYYFTPVIGVLLTLIAATPLNDEFRYAYGIYLCLPLLASQIIKKD